MRKFRDNLKKVRNGIVKITAMAAALAAISSIFLFSIPFYYSIGAVVFIGCIWGVSKFKHKPEKYVNERGYVVLTRENELEHRSIAKKMLGRDLHQNEIVHHINGKKKDNKLRNLCLMDREKHEHFHAWLRWKKEKSGLYPRFREQKRILVEDYGGTLLETLTFKKHESPSPAILKYDENEAHLYEENNSNLTKKLFEELRRERMRLASERGQPAYMIFDDKALHEMVEALPDTNEMMSQIRGVGPTKLRMYGDHFIAVIKKFKSEHMNFKRKGSA